MVRALDGQRWRVKAVRGSHGSGARFEICRALYDRFSHQLNSCVFFFFLPVSPSARRRLVGIVAPCARHTSRRVVDADASVVRHDGSHFHQAVPAPFLQEGDEDPDGARGAKNESHKIRSSEERTVARERGRRLSFLPCLGRRLAGVSGEGGWRRRRDAFGDPTGVTSRETDDGCDQDVANAALDADHAAGSDALA